jgi:GntR family transcriptional regulator of arabinose operon
MEFELHIDHTLRQPLYVQIRESIKNSILDGKLQPGDKLPPESEIAADLGVSIKIVRQALLMLVDEGLIYRRPQRGTFVTDKVPELGDNLQTFNVGLIIHSSTGGWLNDIVMGVGDELSENNYHMFVSNSDNDIRNEAQQVRSFINKGVDGLIIFPVDQLRGQQHDYSHLVELQQARMPFVLIDRYIPHLETDYVVFDSYGGAYDATRYLINLGHRRIGQITEPLSITTNAARIRGYKDALAGAGLKGSSDYICYIDSNSENNYMQIDNLLKKGVTAFLCANPFHLQLACDYLMQIGRASCRERV